MKYANASTAHMELYELHLFALNSLSPTRNFISLNIVLQQISTSKAIICTKDIHSGCKDVIKAMVLQGKWNNLQNGPKLC